MRLSILQALIAIFSSAVLMFLLRAFPFILFSRRKPPKLLAFIEKYIPSMVIGVLIVYCLSDPKFATVTQMPYGIPAVIGVLSTIVLHLKFSNSMVSIFGGTAIFMLLDYLI
jgi:branched-subunit amino acid transport protein AzlD